MIAGVWHNLEMQSEQLEYESKLKEWVEIPSISAEPERRSDIDRLADVAVVTIREFGGPLKRFQRPAIRWSADSGRRQSPHGHDLQPPGRAACERTAGT
jgi:hypothetical protein